MRDKLELSLEYTLSVKYAMYSVPVVIVQRPEKRRDDLIMCCRFGITEGSTCRLLKII